MNDRIVNDERLDPRIRRVFEHFRIQVGGSAAAVGRDRDALVAAANSDEALEERRQLVELLDVLDTEAFAPSDGLEITEHQLVSQPDGNAINLRVVRPQADRPLPCVYYIHGGGMMTQSCRDGNYRAWAKILAAQGVVVAMVDFRNALQPSSVPEIAAYPAGLDDCVSGLGWVVDHAEDLGVDATKIVVSGESGGGNLTLATAMRLLRDGRIDIISGVYAMCPYIAGQWPQARYPSSIENEGIFLTLHGNVGQVAYGQEAFDARDPLAWPAFATEDDVRGMPPTVIRVNEADPLRDEGIAFYRLLQRAGVPARCDQIMGTIHGVEVMPAVCPDITRSAAADIALFARTAGT